MCCSWEMVILPCIAVPAGKGLVLARSCGGGRSAAEGACADYCAVVVRSVVLPEDGLRCAGLALAPSFLISFFASALPSALPSLLASLLASAVLAPPLCLAFFLLGS